ncbi:MAG: hypothetical protein H5U04_06495 [Firmicutes bacterium]|nr:hypothetical protein [Bacillota bacterium]
MPGFLRREIAMVWAVLIVLASFAGGAALAFSFAGVLLPADASEAASSAGQGPPQAVSFTPPPGSVLDLPPGGTFTAKVSFDRRLPELRGWGIGSRFGDISNVSQERVAGKTASFTVSTFPGKELWLHVALTFQDGTTTYYRWDGPVRTKPRVRTSEKLAREIHLTAWEEALDRAGGDDLFRVGLYATRSLAVHRPELYLQADRLFYETASTTMGFGELFEYDPPTWNMDPDELDAQEKRFDGLFERWRAKGNPLEFGRLDLSRYRVVPRAELLPDGAPHYRVVDERVGILPVTLKRAGGALTPVEMAFLRYFVRGSLQTDYVVVFDDGSAGLWTAAGLIDAATGEPSSAPGSSPPTGRSALLVMNERYVWYPLMGRDDRHRDPGLTRAVAGLGSGDSATVGAAAAPGAGPTLSEEERRLVQGLRDLTVLSRDEVPFALMAASKARYRAVEYGPYRDALAAVPYIGPAEFPGSTRVADDKVLHIVGHTFQVQSNWLSPLAAWIAAQDIESELDRSRAVTGLYYDLARQGPVTTARTLWRPELLWYDIEDSILSTGGTCAIQSGNVSALLDLAGIENCMVWISLGEGGHEYVYLPTLGKEVDNGYLHEGEVWLEEYLEPGRASLAGLGSKGRFVVFSGPPHPSTIPASDLEAFLRAWRDGLRRVKNYGFMTETLASYAEVVGAAESGRLLMVDLSGH